MSELLHNQVDIDGILYKVGAHGYVYYWSTDDKGWIRSSKEVSEIFGEEL